MFLKKWSVLAYTFINFSIYLDIILVEVWVFEPFLEPIQF